MRETDPLLGRTSGHAQDEDQDEDQDEEQKSTWCRIQDHLSQPVDADKCYPALTVQCFIAGAADAAVYGYTKTWVGFMTGNITQLSIAAVTLILTHPMPEESVSRFINSSASVLGFIFGAFFSSKVKANYHKSHRGKLFVISIFRCFLYITVSVGIATLGWAGRSGMVMLFVLAANMGSMAVNATQVGSTPYSTTVVFTASMAAFFSDPFLPFSISSANKTRGFSILALIAGACSSQAVSILITRLTSIKVMYHFGPSIPFAMIALAEAVCALLWLQAGKEEE